MSRLIKSSRIVLGSNSYHISSEVTCPPTEMEMEQTSQVERDNTLYENDTKKGADQLMENAEATALSILDEAEEKVRLLIEQAEDDARKIEEEAIEKAKLIYDKQREEGQEEGFSQGFDAGQSEAQVLIDEALMIKEEWSIKKNQFIHQMETDILKLCVNTVENIINREISDEKYILNLIKKGIDNLTYTSSLVVRVSEYDYDYAAGNRSKILAMVEGVENIEVRKDLSLDHGDCVIDTDTGSMDIGVKSQMEQVKKIFDALLASD